MDNLLDISWSLHFTSTNSSAYRNLFDPSTTQNHLSRYFDRLPNFLTSQKPQYVDDLNDENEKLGPLRSCKSTIFRLPVVPSSTHSSSVQIQLIYQHSTFTFILYTPTLVLSKAPATQTKHVLTFLSETFSISIDPFKPPSTLLTTSLQKYISTLVSQFPDNDATTSEKRASILQSAIGTLRLTVSFSGPVAPHLKTADISVPYETVSLLWTSAASKGDTFMASLAGYVLAQTGLRLPLAADGEDDGMRDVQSNAGERAGSVGSTSSSSSGSPVRMVKMTCAAFAIGVEGRLRFAARAIENAVEQENLVMAANIGMLDGIAERAKLRGTAG